MSSIILAGGRGTRLGREKISLVIAGQPLLERLAARLSTLGGEVILVLAQDQQMPTRPLPAGVRAVHDLHPDKGPLGGIYAGLRESADRYAAVVACDMPFLNVELLRYMMGLASGFDAVVLRPHGRIEPLHAVYAKDCLGSIETILGEPKPRVGRLVERVKARFVEDEEIARFDPERLSWFNINTPEDLRRAEALMAAEQKKVHADSPGADLPGPSAGGMGSRRSGFPNMLSVEEAVQKILDHIRVLEPETRPILDSLGQVLGEDVHSEITVPPADVSAVDGYAVRWESLQGIGPERPVELKVMGHAAAGHGFGGSVAKGEAVRIMTGAPIPSGADTVVPFENIEEGARKGSGLIRISVRPAGAGAHIRRAGTDVLKGDRVLAAGTVLRPQEVGVLASIGRAEVRVIRRPIVAVLNTGDELAEVGSTLPPGKLYASNGYALAAQILRYGGIPRLLGIASDERGDLGRKISLAMDADVLLTSGGAAGGDRDLIREALAENGSVVFERVRMRPGKTLVFGMIEKGGRRIPHFGLPGNPVGCMIAFEESVRPAILKMLGRRDLGAPTVIAISENDFANPEGLRLYAKAAVRREGDQYRVRLVGPQGAGILTAMIEANGIVVVPEYVRSVRKGDRVQVHLLDWPLEG